jgi:hypothetical protein
MIELRIHGFKHRLTNSNLLVSSPAGEEDWKERGMEEMNLPQVARSEIRNTINDYIVRYPENFVTQKKSQPEQPKFTANNAQ